MKEVTRITILEFTEIIPNAVGDFEHPDACRGQKANIRNTARYLTEHADDIVVAKEQVFIRDEQ